MNYTQKFTDSNGWTWYYIGPEAKDDDEFYDLTDKDLVISHRLDGPAIVPTDPEEHEFSFWIDDENYKKLDYWKHPKVLEYQNRQILKKALGIDE